MLKIAVVALLITFFECINGSFKPGIMIPLYIEAASSGTTCT